MRALFVLAALAALPGRATTSELEGHLAQMARSEGDAYLAARAAALAAASSDEVRAQLLARAPTAKTWKSDAMLLILDAHRTGGAFEALLALKGIDPRVYLLARRPDPAVARELQGANVHPGALLETMWKTLDRFPYADDSAYPSGVLHRLASLRAKEEEALATGLITGLAHVEGSGAPHLAHAKQIAAHALQYVVTTPRFGKMRLQAAVMLPVADVALARAALPAILRGDDEGDLRAAAAVGLGKVRDVSSLAILEDVAKDDAEPHVRFAAIASMGSVGAKFVRGDDAKGADALRADATARLVAALARGAGTREEDAAVNALATVGHPSAVPALERLQASGTALQQAAARRALPRVQEVLGSP